MTTAKWTIDDGEQQDKDLHYPDARFNEKECCWRGMEML
jgi:hypothetical protein